MNLQFLRVLRRKFTEHAVVRLFADRGRPFFSHLDLCVIANSRANVEIDSSSFINLQPDKNKRKELNILWRK